MLERNGMVRQGPAAAQSEGAGADGGRSRGLKRERPNVLQAEAMNEIEPGLFLGDCIAAQQRDVLLRHGVRHIVQVAEELGAPPFPQDFSYTLVDIGDYAGEDIGSHFERCFEAMDAARAQGGAVLVHCVMGISRSSTIVIGYLMKRHGISLATAFAHVRERRPLIDPNSGFVHELERLEAQLAASRHGQGGSGPAPPKLRNIVRFK
eukprot:TRINITY_DN319_c0_g2_i4.p1 TRINITY_DN319_c0_g2~~TRINITY_DN319_c0_g2_i4.p1  ORF type:complete len:207 (+),score=50.81 TRINITY_DN319_c0_g2_i4:174-794(+)